MTDVTFNKGDLITWVSMTTEHKVLALWGIKSKLGFRGAISFKTGTAVTVPKTVTPTLIVPKEML